MKTAIEAITQIKLEIKRRHEMPEVIIPNESKREYRHWHYLGYNLALEDLLAFVEKLEKKVMP
jgi:hypothetical protein